MLYRTEPREARNPGIAPIEPTESATLAEDNGDAAQQAERRRLMYERIARGNALIEAENTAYRKWLGK